MVMGLAQQTELKRWGLEIEYRLKGEVSELVKYEIENP